jgi:hypothetical protein
MKLFVIQTNVVFYNIKSEIMKKQDLPRWIPTLASNTDRICHFRIQTQCHRRKCTTPSQIIRHYVLPQNQCSIWRVGKGKCQAPDVASADTRVRGHTHVYQVVCVCVFTSTATPTVNFDFCSHPTKNINRAHMSSQRVALHRALFTITIQQNTSTVQMMPLHFGSLLIVSNKSRTLTDHHQGN